MASASSVHSFHRWAHHHNWLSKSGRAFRAVVVAALCQLLSPTIHAQGSAALAETQAASAQPPLPATMAPVPFGVGERMEYEVKYSALKVGVGTMEVKEIVQVRDQPSWHTALTINGKKLGFSVNILLESWFDVTTLASRRFHEDQRYTGYKKNATTEIFPERGMFKEGDKDERVTVAQPIDIGSVLYFVRTIPLEVGKSYSLAQYYKPEANPIVIQVLRKERVTTTAGSFNTIVVRPKIKAKGMFSEESKAEVWLTDDPTRMMVQLKSDLVFGSINMFLSKFKLGPPPPKP